MAQSGPPSINELGWLAGCWELKGGPANTVVSEQWMKPRGNSMIGSGRTVKNGKTTEFEFFRIVQTGDGLSYIARPSDNNAETSFELVKWGNGEFIFENKEHDFPQRIIYRQEKDLSLFARIEGNNNGKLLGINFLSVRVKCEL
jgi:hypothetical protein